MRAPRLLIALAGLAGVLALVTAGVFAALNTAAGRAFVLRQAADAARERAGLTVTIGRTDGLWPVHVVLEDVVIGEAAAPDGPPLFTAERITVAWRPLGLLAGGVDFARLELDGPRLMRLPAAANAPEDARDPPRSPLLRFPVPNVTVETLRIADGRLAPAVLPGGANVSAEASLTRRPGLGPRLTLTGLADLELGVLDESPASAWHGREVHVEIAADAAPRRLDLNLFTATARNAGLEITAASITPGLIAEGRLAAGARPPAAIVDVLGLQSTGRVSLETRFRVAPHAARVWGLTLAQDGVGAIARGGASVSGAPAAFEGEAALNIAPTAARLFATDLELAGEVELTIAARGDASDMTATFAAATPPLRVSAIDAPALVADARVTGLPSALDARVSLRPRADPAGAPGGDRLEAHITTHDWSRMRVERLSALYRGAAAEAEGAVALAPLGGDGRATLTVPDIERLAPTLGIAGDVAVNGAAAYSPDGLALDLAAEADALSVGGVRLQDLALAVVGDHKALAADATVGRVRAPGLPAVTDGVAETTIAPTFGAEGPRVTVTISRLEALIAAAQARLTAATVVTAAPGLIDVAPSAFAWGADGVVRGAFRVDADALRASLAVETFPLPALDGALSGEVALDTAAAPPGRASVALVSRPEGRPAARLLVDGVWDGAVARLEAAIEGVEEGSPLARTPIARARLPAKASFGPQGVATDVSGDAEIAVDYRGPVAPLFGLAGFAEQALEGRLDADLRLAGPYDDLRAGGAAVLQDATYEHERIGLRLRGLSARLEGEGGLEDLRLMVDVEAEDERPHEGGPAWRGRGDLRPQPDGPPALDVSLTLNRASVVRRGDLSATASGALSLTGGLRDLSLTGRVAVDSVDAAAPENTGGETLETVRVVRVDAPADAEPPPNAAPSSPSTAPPPASPFRLALDVAVTADDRIFFRGRGLETEWTADLRVRGTANDPRLVGEVAIRQGVLDFAGRRLDVTEGVLTFGGEPNPDPLLSVQAETRALTGERLMVSITGRASDPQITLSSEPVLPEEDVLALLLFGRPVTELSAFESVRLAQAVAALSGVGPFGGQGMLDRTRRSLGLDVLQVTQSESGAAGLTVGKYVTDRVFVAANQDVTGEAGSVTIAVSLTDSITLNTDVGQDASGSVGLNWRIDY